MTKVAVVIFTYNRALQLDALLGSLFRHFGNLGKPVHVIYHWSKEHEASYNLLKEKWEKEGVVFHQRGGTPRGRLFRLLFRPVNLYWYLRDKWLRNSFDNFKFILEKVIASAAQKYVVFSTDDQIMFKDTVVPESAFELMRENPREYSYRFITSLRFRDEHAIPPDLPVKIHADNGAPAFFEWSNAHPSASEVWKYRFHVDGTVYDQKALLRLLRPMIYHMPTTLEGVGLWESRLRGYFKTGLSSIERTLVGVQANNIQTVSATPSASFSPQVLMRAFLAGYRLQIMESDIDPDTYIYIPAELHFIHEQTSSQITYSEFLEQRR